MRILTQRHFTINQPLETQNFMSHNNASKNSTKKPTQPILVLPSTITLATITLKLATITALATIMLLGLTLTLTTLNVQAEEGDGEIYLDEPFNNSSWTHGWADAAVGSRNHTVMQQAHTGTGLGVAINKGAHFGTAAYWRFENHGYKPPERAWFRYWLRFDTPVEGKGKLPGYTGRYSASGQGRIAPSATQPGWSARMTYAPGDTPQDIQIGFYTYHLDQEKAYGESSWFLEDIHVGEWYCIEGLVALNDIGESNGELRGFVDGNLVLAEGGWQFRSPTQKFVKIRDFWLDIYSGGRIGAATNMHLTIDSVALGTGRIGCQDTRPAEVKTGRYADDDESIFENAIEALAYADITKGCGEDQYCGEEHVTRGQMAAFIQRALKNQNITLPTTPQTPFNDTSETIFQTDIEWLNTTGITRGCNPPANTKYCPDKPVTRGQMAVFLVRALQLQNTGQQKTFTDTQTHMFKTEIEILAQHGITKGCNPPNNTLFCPNSYITREQMAAFLQRALQLDEIAYPDWKLDGRIEGRDVERTWNTQTTPIPVITATQQGTSWTVNQRAWATPVSYEHETGEMIQGTKMSIANMSYAVIDIAADETNPEDLWVARREWETGQLGIVHAWIEDLDGRGSLYHAIPLFDALDPLIDAQDGQLAATTNHIYVVVNTQRGEGVHMTRAPQWELRRYNRQTGLYEKTIATITTPVTDMEADEKTIVITNSTNIWEIPVNANNINIDNQTPTTTAEPGCIADVWQGPQTFAFDTCKSEFKQIRTGADIIGELPLLFEEETVQQVAGWGNPYEANGGIWILTTDGFYRFQALKQR